MLNFSKINIFFIYLIFFVISIFSILNLQNKDNLIISKKVNSDGITENQFFGNVHEIKDEDDTAFSELIIKIGNSQDFQLLLIRITKYQLEKLKINKYDKIYILVKSTSFDRQAII